MLAAFTLAPDAAALDLADALIAKTAHLRALLDLLEGAEQAFADLAPAVQADYRAAVAELVAELEAAAQALPDAIHRTLTEPH